MSAESPLNFKIVALGSPGVGKTSIIQRLIEGTFTEQNPPTSGADFYSAMSEAGGQQIKLQIWDTAGQETFRAISKAYFRNAFGAILVFDITSPASFEELDGWLNDLQLLAVPNAYILLIANKMDLEADRQVAQAQVKTFADTHQLSVVETSASSGLNVQTAFQRLSDEIYARVANGDIQAGPAAAGQLPPSRPAAAQETGQGCC